MQTVRNTEELRQALAAGHKADQIEMAHPITQAQLDAAVAAARTEARAEGVAEGKSAAQGEAVAAERKRIAEVQALARSGFDAELKSAIESGDSPEKFALTLMKAAAERGVTLEAIKKDSPPPATRSNPPAGDEKPKAAIDTAAIYAARQPKKE